jgi:hypothetical protein
MGATVIGRDLGPRVSSSLTSGLTADCTELEIGSYEDKKSGKETDRRNMCECHVARPTRFGFPVVRLDDFCSFHADPKTGERAYAGLVANVSTVV